jgi:hypothetical protein
LAQQKIFFAHFFCWHSKNFYSTHLLVDLLVDLLVNLLADFLEIISKQAAAYNTKINF